MIKTVLKTNIFNHFACKGVNDVVVVDMNCTQGNIKMAARRLCIFFGSSRYLKNSRPQKFCQFHTKSTVNGSFSRNVIAFTSGCFGSLALFELYNYKQVPGPKRTLICIAASEEGKAEEDAPKVMSRRERRFNQFASCEYSGEVLMTAQDFLESLTENEPKCK